MITILIDFERNPKTFIGFTLLKRFKMDSIKSFDFKTFGDSTEFTSQCYLVESRSYQCTARKNNKRLRVFSEKYEQRLNYRSQNLFHITIIADCIYIYFAGFKNVSHQQMVCIGHIRSVINNCFPNGIFPFANEIIAKGFVKDGEFVEGLVHGGQCYYFKLIKLFQFQSRTIMKKAVYLQQTDAFGRLQNSSPDGGCHGSTIRYWHRGEEMCQFFISSYFQEWRNYSSRNRRVIPLYSFGTSPYKSTTSPAKNSMNSQQHYLIGNLKPSGIASMPSWKSSLENLPFSKVWHFVEVLSRLLSPPCLGQRDCVGDSCHCSSCIKNKKNPEVIRLNNRVLSFDLSVVSGFSRK